ncbi:MAG: hypothetical protein JW769_00420 [Parachlamydiales bacterium]|nr:hypothetical protein [Parachlamydiales bacterium]
MNKNMFSRIAVTSVALLATAFAYAIPKEPCDKQEPVCCEKPASGPYAFSYMKDKGLSCPSDVYINGDFLWMMATEQGLDYAVEHTSGNALSDGELHGFSAPNESWDWQPGARVTIGAFTQDKEWNLEASWTYLHIKEDGATHDATNTLSAIWLPDLNEYNYASARWKSHYNTIDLKLAKPYHLNRYFTMNPFIAIRGAWIEQDYLARYSTDGHSASIDMVADNDYYGFGLRGGAVAEWIFTKNFNLFGQIAASLLYGKFDVDQRSVGETVGLTSAAYKIHQEFYDVSPNMDLTLGAIWGTYFNKNKYKISAKIAYEFHQWWDQNNMRKVLPNTGQIDTISRGDLALNGFAFGLLFDF